MLLCTIVLAFLSAYLYPAFKELMKTHLKGPKAFELRGLAPAQAFRDHFHLC
jgi:hypothetical protein